MIIVESLAETITTVLDDCWLMSLPVANMAVCTLGTAVVDMFHCNQNSGRGLR